MSAKNRGGITLKKLRSMLDYDPETGHFTWKVRVGANVMPGQRAGSAHESGRRHIMMDGVCLQESRVAWWMHYGREPRGRLKRVNRVPDDNRIANLQEPALSD